MAEPSDSSGAALEERVPSTPRNAREEQDLFTSIIPDLAADCDSAFSHPPLTYQSSSVSFPSHSPRQEDMDCIQARTRGSLTLTSIELEDIAGEESRGHSFENDDDAHDMTSLYPTSKRSSLSQPQRVYLRDSAISLIKPGETRTSKKSNLQIAKSAYEELPSPIQNDDDRRPEEATPVYPSTAKTAVIMVSLYISIFLVALDRTIIGPAIPAITDEFDSIDDIGWYGSAYMLTAAGFILLYGRIYTFFPTKPVFLSGIFLFEGGSAVCGAAQSSMTLIIGRAIAGLGSSAIFTGAVLIMMNTVPLHRRPMLQGLFGACFGFASVAGPLLGGAFTGSKATWRWCFYINLPLGGLTILATIFLLKLEEQKQKLATWKETILHLDPLGTILFLPAISCLLLALQWGAAEYAWSSPRLVALLAVFAFLLLAFVAWQYFTRNTTATIPARILRQRSVVCGGASQFCVGSTMITFSLYIPLWFQAIKGVSAMQSGINTIPLVLSVVVGSISSGVLVQRIGYYTPFVILGSCFMSLGAGLMTTWNVHSSPGMWIGYQVLLGLGVGYQMQHPNLAVQVVLPKHDVPTGTATLSLCQTLGGAVFAAVGQNLYIDKFSHGLQSIGGLDVKRILQSGATDLTTSVPLAMRPEVLGAYNHALTKGTFFAALIVACLALPAALGMEWRSVKEEQNSELKPQDEEKLIPAGGIPRGKMSAMQVANREQEELTPECSIGPILVVFDSQSTELGGGR